MILNLQYLRGVAALMVVVFHVTDSAGRLGAVALPHFATGFAGVDLFFVISGFIIYVTTRSGETRRPGPFLVRRIARIVPLYWLLTALLAAVAITLPGWMGASVFETWHTLASFLFWPALHPTFGLYNPLLVVGWTLNYEMAFYALFALVLVLPARFQFAAATLAILAAAGAGLFFAPPGVAGFYTDPIILEFAAGLLIGHLRAGGARLPLSACLALATAGVFGLLFAQEETRWLTAGLPAALLVAGAVFSERESGPLALPGLRLLGDASYSLYLVHLPALAVFQIVYGLLGLPAILGLRGLYVLLASLACVAAGLLCYGLVERPLNRFLLPRRRAGASGPAAVARPALPH